MDETVDLHSWMRSLDAAPDSPLPEDAPMRRSLRTLPPLLLSLAACHAERPSPPPEFITAPGAAASLPFSEAVRANGWLILSGQIGVKPGTIELVSGGIEAEAKQTMDNIVATLARQNLTTDDVVKCSVFLAEIKDWPAFNAIYRGYFGKHFPARSALAASGLALNARVEVECVAVDRHAR